MAAVAGTVQVARPQNFEFGAELTTPDEGAGAAQGIEDGFKKQGSKPTSTRKDVPVGDLEKDLKKDLADAFEGDHLKCENGVFVFYLIAHGKDGNVGRIKDFKDKKTVPLQDISTWVCSIVPKCCVLVFSVDACNSESWQKQNFMDDGTIRDSSPFHGVQCVVAMPTNGYACYGPMVGKAMIKQFGQRRTAGQYADELAKEEGVRATAHLTDTEHESRVVTTPEPCGMVVTLSALAFLARRSRAKRAALG